MFCQSDEMAFGAMQVLQRAGIRIPAELSVIGFDDHELAGAFELTTVGQPISAQGAAAARWLTAGLEAVPPVTGSIEPPIRVGIESQGEIVLGPVTDRPGGDDALHPVRLVRRGSTGPPPA